MTQVTIGGERLGSGNRMKADLHNYERSTFDLSYIFRTTMASGTLVPFMTEVALPGDTFDINLQGKELTHPTIGPLFGSYKTQYDVFIAPIRNYQAQLHMNMLNIGRDMSAVKFPLISMAATAPTVDKPIDNQQINPSCIFSYLGIRGLGMNGPALEQPVNRTFHAIPYLAYWDIYKNYYANKQEEIGAVIHKTLDPDVPSITGATLTNLDNNTTQTINIIPPPDYTGITPVFATQNLQLLITATSLTKEFDAKTGIQITWQDLSLPFPEGVVNLGDAFGNVSVQPENGTILASNPIWTTSQETGKQFGLISVNPDVAPPEIDTEPQILTFPLKNIDDMRMNILQWNPDNGPFMIDTTTQHPYDLPLRQYQAPGGPVRFTKQYSQEGLALKTYQSDLFNNWISTDWIDGPDGISAVTAIDTSSGSFTIDELNLSRKIYVMLNRIAISGGTYDDWQEAVYVHNRKRSAENPMYMGGMIQNIIFDEVVSNSRSTGTFEGKEFEQPLGTLAGRGMNGNKHKGGHIVIKVDEPSYIMGIVSITPIIDYSQGNKWDVNLKTMNDLHKPQLSQIGFQDLITDQMAWFETRTNNTEAPYFPATFKSAGKQPAWINYMTNVNVVRGNFAEQSQQMFMTLNRRYNANYDPLLGFEIEDLTTYIDPAKFNYIFANTKRDAQNFWVQIGVNISARRKMSSKVIPNL